jgi:type I restriction enzyme M protein
MSMLLHGIGGESDTTDLPLVTKDALAGKHGEYDFVLANPPFGKKSSVPITNEEGEACLPNQDGGRTLLCPRIP